MTDLFGHQGHAMTDLFGHQGHAMTVFCGAMEVMQ
jgi:hypothetical protein